MNNMDNPLVNQITLSCLANKSIIKKHLVNQGANKADKKEYNFYRKRIFFLFKDMINGKEQDNVSYDVKCAFDAFVNISINYFKMADSNDLLQEEYKDIVADLDVKISDSIQDLSDNLVQIEANQLLMRQIKMDTNTLDKYVKRVSHDNKDKIIITKSREVDITNPELKNKGLKKNNISNLYEDNDEKQNNKEKKNDS